MGGAASAAGAAGAWVREDGVEANAESVIGEGASLSGKVSGKDLTILGRFEGEADAKARLRIGPNGSVKGLVRAATVEVNGRFDGEIRATRISFGGQASARGTFRADRISMDEGAWVEGGFNPVDTASEKAASVPAPNAAATPTAPASTPPSPAPPAAAPAPVAAPPTPAPAAPSAGPITVKPIPIAPVDPSAKNAPEKPTNKAPVS